MQNVILIMLFQVEDTFGYLIMNKTGTNQCGKTGTKYFFSEFWYKEFRMKPDTFEYIVKLVSPNISKKDTAFRRAVAVEKRVAVAIWRLSTGNLQNSI